MAVQVCTPAIKVPFAPHPQQHELSYVPMTLKSQGCQKTGVRWNLEVVLVCISLMAKDPEQKLFLRHVRFLSREFSI